MKSTRLATEMTALRQQGREGAIYLPPAPVTVAADDDALKNIETLLFLTWDPGTEGPWFARLGWLPLQGGEGIVVWEREGSPPQLLARLAPIADAPLWDAFIRDFFANPAAYHAEPLDPADLPQTITSYRPDLLATTSLRAAVSAWTTAPGYFESVYVEDR